MLYESVEYYLKIANIVVFNNFFNKYVEQIGR